MLGLSPHPGVSYLFQNQTHITPADEALWNVALGSTALGGTAGAGGGLNSPPPSWTPAQGELVLKVDSKFKVRKSALCVRVLRMLRVGLDALFTFLLCTENYFDAAKGPGRVRAE